MWIKYHGEFYCVEVYNGEHKNILQVVEMIITLLNAPPFHEVKTRYAFLKGYVSYDIDVMCKAVE